MIYWHLKINYQILTLYHVTIGLGIPPTKHWSINELCESCVLISIVISVPFKLVSFIKGFTASKKEIKLEKSERKIKNFIVYFFLFNFFNHIFINYL